MPRLSTLLVSVLVVGFMASSAAAQEPSDLQKAREHYAAAEQAMKSGDHALAAGEYGKAYEITRDPVLFYKIASAHYEARNCADAVTYFTRYLAEGKPDEKFRAVTQERIDACTARAEQGSGDAAATAGTGDRPAGSAGQESSAASEGVADTSAGPSGDDSGNESANESGGESSGAATAGLPGGDARPPSFADQEVTWQSKAAWVSVGLAATFVTAGAVLGLSASSREEDLRNLIEFRYADGKPAIYAGNPRARYEDYIDEGERLAGYSRLALGAAGLAAVSATVFFILDARSGKEAAETSAQIAPLATPDALGMSAGWRF